MEATPISSWRSDALERLRTARANGHHDVAAKLTRELQTVHTALGERRTGTREEQNAYLLARTTSTPLPELLAAGIDTNQWPDPPSFPAVAEPLPASPVTSQRIRDIFQAAGPLAEGQASGPRYVAEYRPQDGQVYRGKPLPWAIWDTREAIAIAHHADQDLCEYQASRASDRYDRRGRPA